MEDLVMLLVTLAVSITFMLFSGGVGAAIAASRGASGSEWFVVGLLFGPVGWLLAGLMAGRSAEDEGPVRASEVARCTRVIELDPTSAAAYVRRGNVYRGRLQLQPAVDDFSRAIELDPANAEAFSSRGLAHQSLGKDDLAIADFTKVIELDPGNAAAYADRGAAEAHAGDSTAATADFDRAIDRAIDRDRVAIRRYMREARLRPS